MKFFLPVTLLLLSCSSGIDKEPETSSDIVPVIELNYLRNKEDFQVLAREFASYQWLRSIHFKDAPRAIVPLSVYCEKINRDSNSYSLGWNSEVDLARDGRIKEVLNREGLPDNAFHSIYDRLCLLNCSGFFTHESLDRHTGETLMVTEFFFDNGEPPGEEKFCYRVYNRKPKKTGWHLGRRGGRVLDSNTLWTSRF